MIKRNIGTIDRIARFIIGHTLVIIGFFVLDAVEGATAGVVLSVIGALFIMTAAVGRCVGYRLFNYSTIKQPEA